jgi:transcriptional regulator with XRE-family HTH domain
MKKKPRRKRGIPTNGTALRELRESIPLTQAELAARARVDEKTVRRGEQGRLDAKSLRMISDALRSIHPALLVELQPSLLQPPTTKAKAVRFPFTGFVDVPAEMADILRDQNLAVLIFIGLKFMDLIKDGALNITLAPSNSIAIGAMLTRADIEGISAAFMEGLLEPFRIVAIRIDAVTPQSSNPRPSPTARQLSKSEADILKRLFPQTYDHLSDPEKLQLTRDLEAFQQAERKSIEQGNTPLTDPVISQYIRDRLQHQIKKQAKRKKRPSKLPPSHIKKKRQRR